MRYLSEVNAMMDKDTDISSHLATMYTEVSKFLPRLIVELGVRGGESSKIFDMINREIGSRVIGVDIEPCAYDVHNGHFLQMDDLEFAERFPNITSGKIDVLMIDTCHLYEHTLKELKTFLPHLADRCMILMHDSNLKQQYVRHNGTIGGGWDNDRGVVRALQTFFQQTFDEGADFERDFRCDDWYWKVRHFTICNGLMLCWGSRENPDREIS